MNDEPGIGVESAWPALRAAHARSPLYATPPGTSHRLRVVLVAPEETPFWLRLFFDLLPASPWLDVVVLPIAGQPVLRPLRVPADLRALLWYERRHAAGAMLAPTPVGSHEGVEFAAAIDGDLDMTAVRCAAAALRPDLVLLLGKPQWAEALGDGARWGCWQIDPSLFDAGRATQALLGPVMRGDVSTEVTLELRHRDQPPTALVSSRGSTCRSSAVAQRERGFRKIPALLMRVLRRMASGDLLLPPQRTTWLQLACAESSTRSGAGLCAFARTFAFRFAARWRRSQRSETAWNLLIRQDPQPIDPVEPRVGRPAILKAPGDLFWADPCVVEDGSRRLIFVEQWSRDGKGVIACLELLPDNRVRQLGTALDHATHLSYPQPFQWGGQWYLTVESGQQNCVSLYRAAAFPLQWEFAGNLIEGWKCVDPTLYRHGEHWYLFANVAESGGSTWDELFLFVADNPTGPFHPHPANPIVSDARSARPAGRLFHRDGRLVRPGQDCGPRYGAAVVFNEVLELTPTHYREQALGRLDNGRELNMDGCHTYNQIDGVEVLDALGTPPLDLVALMTVELVADAAADGNRLMTGLASRPDWSSVGVLRAKSFSGACRVDRADPGTGLLKP